LLSLSLPVLSVQKQSSKSVSASGKVLSELPQMVIIFSFFTLAIAKVRQWSSYSTYEISMLTLIS